MIVNPAVSVVMSVYNGERYLREAVDSILAQTFTDFEFIIIDDGSTDTTREILESFQDGRITLVHQENMGVTRALNSGFALASGKYIARQDADDVSKAERLEKQVAYMEAHPAVGLLGTRFEFIDNFGQVARLSWLPTENRTLQERLKVINQFSHGSVIIRKEALDKVGVFRDFFKYAQDYDLWLRIAEQFEVVNLPEHLFCYRELEKAISSSKILSQSLYAGVAAEMAHHRRATGSDTLQNGMVPELPQVQMLSKDLHEKLVNFYAQNPHDMLNNLQVDLKCYHDMVYLFEEICAKEQQFQAELKNRDKLVNDLDGKTQRIVSEQTNRILELMQTNFKQLFDSAMNKQAEELLQKDKIIALKDSEAAGLKCKIDDLSHQLCGAQEQFKQKGVDVALRDGQIGRLNEELISAEELRIEQDNQLKQKYVELADRDERIRQAEEDLTRADEVQTEQKNLLDQKSVELADRNERLRQAEKDLAIAEEVRTEQNNQLKQIYVELADRNERIRQAQEELVQEKQRVEEQMRLKEEMLQRHSNDLQATTVRLRASVEELSRINAEKDADKMDFQQQLREKEQRIENLLNSKSWKITAPLRAVLELTKTKKKPE